MKENIIELMESFKKFEKAESNKIEVEVEKYKRKVACILNKRESDAMENNLGEDYVNAIRDIKKLLEMKGTIYELFVN